MPFEVVIAALLFAIIFKFRPWIDITREGDVLLWYNDGCRREYKHLFNIHFKK